MQATRVNLRYRDDSGSIVRVTEATEWKPLPASITIPASLVLIALLLKLLQYSLVTLVLF